MGPGQGQRWRCVCVGSSGWYRWRRAGLSSQRCPLLIRTLWGRVPFWEHREPKPLLPSHLSSYYLCYSCSLSVCLFSLWAYLPLTSHDLPFSLSSDTHSPSASLCRTPNSEHSLCTPTNESSHLTPDLTMLLKQILSFPQQPYGGQRLQLFLFPLDCNIL